MKTSTFVASKHLHQTSPSDVVGQHAVVQTLDPH
ncbi:unnamed protein product [Amoebophrya sp. A120]|nr:unnamed protein product [Amoebophrya sp. A120]|eukprot:GSA120T00026379001.1